MAKAAKMKTRTRGIRFHRLTNAQRAWLKLLDCMTIPSQTALLRYVPFVIHAERLGYIVEFYPTGTVEFKRPLGLLNDARLKLEQGLELLDLPHCHRIVGFRD